MKKLFTFCALFFIFLLSGCSSSTNLKLYSNDDLDFQILLPKNWLVTENPWLKRKEELELFPENMQKELLKIVLTAEEEQNFENKNFKTNLNLLYDANFMSALSLEEISKNSDLQLKQYFKNFEIISQKKKGLGSKEKIITIYSYSQNNEKIYGLRSEMLKDKKFLQLSLFCNEKYFSKHQKDLKKCARSLEFK